MALPWLLILAFVGASSAFQNGVTSTRNTTSLLETYPSVVQVETVSQTGWAIWTQTCVGTILNNRNILTAASCGAEPNIVPSQLRIRAGANYLNTGGFIHNVQVVIPSPAFNITSTSWRDDVAVLRLTSYLIYSNIIERATIAAPGSIIPPGITLNQLGWESTNSSALSEVSIVTIALANCGLTFNDTQSLCSAPSPLLDNASPGSPLLYQGINVGLISGVNFVDNSTTNLVSADVASYTDWIISVVV